jgi:UDP-glucose 4-epimerase
MTDIKNKKILLTGGAGFVGSNIAKVLLEKGSIVTIVDNLYTGFESLVPKHKNLTFIKGDIENIDLIDDLVSKNPLIIHAAAKNIIASTKNVKNDFETNIGGTLNLLIAARKYKIEKFVYTGSASVYGNPNQIPVSENSPLYTLSPYAVSKLAGENYCTAFYETYNLPTTIVRYSNVYGTNQHINNPYCGVVTKFFESAMNGEPINIHGNGEQTRDYTFVNDAVSATLEALINTRSTGMIFNIGTGVEISVNELSKKIIEITGSKSKIVHVDKRDIDNIRRRVMNIEQIRRILKWAPNYTLEQGLNETFNWIKKSRLEIF